MNIAPLAMMSADHVRRYSTDRNFSGNSVDPDQIHHYAPDLGQHARIQEFSSQGGGGGPGQSDKKALTFFLVISLFYRSKMVNFKENYHFSRSQRGSNIFQGGGGVQLFPGGGGGSNCLFPIETHIT